MCFWGLIGVLLGFVLGCQSPDLVTVSGAVHQPGGYRYRSDWRVADYILAAGGYVAEADSAHAYVMRDVADSTGKIQSQKIVLSAQMSVSPTEEIRVPLRTYTVHFDSVFAIKDVRIETAHVVFQLDRGVMVPGQTERGVRVAVLLGRGKTYEWPDTTKATTGFHYLYVHFHPNEYSRMQVFAGQAVDSLEALEDADAIHQAVFPSREYQIAGMATLPVDGYFSVYRGVLFAPKNRTRPGDGMRQRLFDDGRVWTTYGDGRQRWQFPDGRVEVTFANGQKEVRYRDGRLAYWDGDGTVRTVYPDGREVLSKAVDRMAVLEEKPVVSQRPSMLQNARSKANERVPDTIEVVYNGLHRKFPNGREVWQRSDGGMVERMPDGHLIQRSALGEMYESFADGRTIEVDRFGQRVETWSDNQRFLTLPPHYGYPGALHSDLAEVADMPDQLPSQGELTVAGQVLNEHVLEVLAYAFMVPDGDVRLGRLTRKGDRFVAKFKFQEDGHYRVQVQVRLPELETFAVAHHAVRVGKPDALPREVMPLSDYPGDDAAAQRLIDQVNDARRRLKRGYVMSHPELMVVAQMRLQEMVARSKVSHLSITGTDVLAVIQQRNIRLRRVSENVANARFLEALHPHWMMSGGHRRAILSSNWTHMGAAVTEFAGSVWAVEVFGAF